MHVYVNATEDVPRSTHIIPGSFHNNKFSIPSVANFNFDDHLTRQILPFFSNENRPSPSTPWTPTFQHSFFDGSGNALDETLPFRENEIFLLYQGGRFIWPGISPGFKRRIPIDNKSVLTLHTLSVVPLVYEVEEQFLTDDESDYIKQTAGPFMKHSDVVLMDKDKGKKSNEWRTSQTHFLSAKGDEMLKSLDERVEQLVRSPKSWHEAYQVLRYEKTEKYSSHHDFFNPELYANDKHTQLLIEGGLKNRLATVFFYLSDVEEGGATNFPRAHGGPRPRSFEGCKDGMNVFPKKGKVIVFYNMGHDGQLDEYSLHGGCPVEKGVKWSANKWIWNSPVSFSDYK